MASASLNKIFLIGRLTKDPELRYTPSGSQVTRFTLAVNRDFKKSDDPSRQQADFIDITTWQKLAEVCNSYLHKGSLVFVEGRLQIRSYDAKDGTKRKATEVIASSVQFLETKRSDSYGSSSSSSSDDGFMPEDDFPPFEDDSEVPF